MLGLLGAPLVLVGELALALGRLAVARELGLGALGALEVLGGLRTTGAGLDATLTALGLASLAHLRERHGEQQEQQHRDDDEDDQPGVHATAGTRVAVVGTARLMAHLDIDTVLGWRGREVRDPGGEKIGKLGDVFLDRETDRPAWAGVRTGLFGHHESYIPLERIEQDADGDLVVPFDKETVKDAPRIDPEVALTAEEEHALYVHYGQEHAYLSSGEPEIPEHERARDSLGDDAMTRSEEEVHVHEGPRKPVERVRLRKVEVTEHQRRVVPVQREVIQLETEPAPEGHIEHVEEVDRVDDPSTRAPEQR